MAWYPYWKLPFRDANSSYLVLPSFLSDALEWFESPGSKVEFLPSFGTCGPVGGRGAGRQRARARLLRGDVPRQRVGGRRRRRAGGASRRQRRRPGQARRLLAARRLQSGVAAQVQGRLGHRRRQPRRENRPVRAAFCCHYFFYRVLPSFTEFFLDIIAPYSQKETERISFIGASNQVSTLFHVSLSFGWGVTVHRLPSFTEFFLSRIVSYPQNKVDWVSLTGLMNQISKVFVMSLPIACRVTVLKLPSFTEFCLNQIVPYCQIIVESIS